jgi:hypothetical protein
MDARSTLLRRQHLSECKIKFGSQLRGIPKGGRRQSPFGCRRHRDNKEIVILQKNLYNYIIFDQTQMEYLLNTTKKGNEFENYVFSFIKN